MRGEDVLLPSPLQNQDLTHVKKLQCITAALLLKTFRIQAFRLKGTGEGVEN